MPAAPTTAVAPTAIAATMEATTAASGKQKHFAAFSTL